jgi:putative membrane protein
MSRSIAQQPMPDILENTGAAMPMFEYYGSGWAGFLWMLFWMVFWVVLFGGVIWLMVRSLHRSILHMGHREVRILSSEPSAIEILRRRYARGDIDEYTFARMRAQLEEAQAPEEASHRVPVMTGK